MSAELSQSSLKRLEKAVFSSDPSILIDETQQEINHLDSKLNKLLSERYQEILQYCKCLNETSETLDNLIELNNWTNEHLQEIHGKFNTDLEEYKNLLEIEKNLNTFSEMLRNICMFDDEMIKIETSNDVFLIVTGMKRLEKAVLQFKGFNFHHKFNSKFMTFKANVLKNTRKEAENLLDYNKSLYESFGCEYLSSLKQKTSLIFESRYNFHKDANIQKIYDILYIYSAYRDIKNLVDKLNSYRELSFQSLFLEHSNINSDLYNTIGFFIIESYLMEINPLFDLKEVYQSSIQRLIQSIKSKEKDPLEQKAYLLALKQALSHLIFDVNMIENEILQLALFFFKEKQGLVASFTDVPQYMEEIEKMTHDLDNQDIETLMIKNIDDVLLRLSDTSSEYSSLLDDIQHKYSFYTFRSISKYKKTQSTKKQKIKNQYEKKFDVSLQIRDIDEFHSQVESHLKEITNLDLSQQEKQDLINEMRQILSDDLELKEKNNPKNKVNYNAKRALIMRLMDSYAQKIDK